MLRSGNLKLNSLTPVGRPPHPKSPWDEVLADVDEMLVAARKRVVHLESARKSFKEMARKGLPWPGTESEDGRPKDAQ